MRCFINISRYCPINVRKLQGSYICGEIANQTKNNEAYNGTKIGHYPYQSLQSSEQKYNEVFAISY